MLDEHHLLSVLTEFVRYYNTERPHRTLSLQTPEVTLRPVTGPIRSRPVLNGLHHAYERAACENGRGIAAQQPLPQE